MFNQIHSSLAGFMCWFVLLSGSLLFVWQSKTVMMAAPEFDIFNLHARMLPNTSRAAQYAQLNNLTFALMLPFLVPVVSCLVLLLEHRQWIFPLLPTKKLLLLHLTMLMLLHSHLVLMLLICPMPLPLTMLLHCVVVVLCLMLQHLLLMPREGGITSCCCTWGGLFCLLLKSWCCCHHVHHSCCLENSTQWSHGWCFCHVVFI